MSFKEIREALIYNGQVYQLMQSKEEKVEEHKIPFKLRGNIEIINKADEPDGDKIIAGYANVTIVDDSEQFIPVETLQEGIKSLLSDPHYSNLMIMHGNIQIGKIISEYKELKTHVDDKGLFIVCQLRNDLKIATEIWQQILDDNIKGFSIGCEVLEDHDECNEERCVTVLDRINIFEVSICESPVNKESGFKVITKSEFNSLYPKDCMSKCNNTNIGENMAKKKVETKSEDIKDEEIKEKSEDKETKETPEPVEETKSEPEPEPVKESETVTEEKEDTPEPEVEEKSVTERLNDIDSKIEELSNIISALIPDTEEKEDVPPEDEDDEAPPEDYEDEVPPESDEWSEDKPKPEETVEEKTKEEETPTEVKEEPKSDFDEIKKSIDSILEKLNEYTKGEDFKSELKARDDIINSLSKKIEIITKARKEKAEPKTVQAKDDNIQVESDIVIHRGMVYHR